MAWLSWLSHFEPSCGNTSFNGLRYVKLVFGHSDGFFKFGDVGVNVFSFHFDAFSQVALRLFFCKVVCKSLVEGGCYFIPQSFICICYSPLELSC